MTDAGFEPKNTLQAQPQPHGFGLYGGLFPTAQFSSEPCPQIKQSQIHTQMECRRNGGSVQTQTRDLVERRNSHAKCEEKGY